MLPYASWRACVRHLAATDAASAAYVRHAVEEASQMADSADGGDSGAEAAALADLLYRRGGGGAGGMSGFFRYLLQACYVPGTDMVGGLLGLYETPQVAQLLGGGPSGPPRRTAAGEAAKCGEQRGDDACMVPVNSSPHILRQPTASSLRRPHGRLFYTCDVVVSGEGSFDDQTISSHKTVIRLLEMCAAANAYRLWHHYCNDIGAAEAAWREGRGCRCITDVVIVCGRCGFDDYTQFQTAVLQAVCSTLLPPHTSKDSVTPMLQEAADVSADTACLQGYLRDLTQSTAFWRACGALPCAREGVRSASELFSAYCVPRVTVLPLTPTLYPVSVAMQQSYECVVSVMTHLLEESVRRMARARERSAGGDGGCAFNSL
ncbi:hypothetical protein GH5_08438 [Leishmania sp. Ghana 2012 LV757]|uniref:hypothetical protein n=1 Tax=Leishmania sp. Ghana 2012 LV757 TaxID=2803181 RepID=UPI001B61C514|nr:hypothetical protein GH5_08438 [Leishmania sp. Ghana 2012 LV757]